MSFFDPARARATLVAPTAVGATKMLTDRPVIAGGNQYAVIERGNIKCEIATVLSTFSDIQGNNIQFANPLNNPHSADATVECFDSLECPYWWWGLAGDNSTDDAPAARAAGLALSGYSSGGSGSVNAARNLYFSGQGHTFLLGSPVIFPAESRRRQCKWQAAPGFTPADVDNAMIIDGALNYTLPNSFTAVGGVVTTAAAHGMNTGGAVMFFNTGGSLVGAIEGRVYYIIKLTNTTYNLADSLANANALNANVNITAGAGQSFSGLSDIGRRYVEEEFINCAMVPGVNGHRANGQQPGYERKMRVDNAAAFPAPAAPVVTPGSGGTMQDGTYNVAVSYLNRLGETLASASTIVIVNTGSNTGSIVVTSPTATTQTGNSAATGWHAYVSAVGSTSPLFRQDPLGTGVNIGTNFTLSAPPNTASANPLVTSTAGSWGSWLSSIQFQFINFMSFVCDTTIIAEGLKAADWLSRLDMEQFTSYGIRTANNAFGNNTGNGISNGMSVTGMHIEIPAVAQNVIDLTNIPVGPPRCGLVLIQPYSTKGGNPPVGIFLNNPLGGDYTIIGATGTFPGVAGYPYINDPVNGSRDAWSDYHQQIPPLIIVGRQTNVGTTSVKSLDIMGQGAASLNGLVLRRVTFDGTVGNYNQKAGDTYICLVNGISAPRLVNLQPAAMYASGLMVIVKDETGAVGAVNKITITPNGADTIDGAANLAITTARGVARLISNGSNQWNVI